MKWKYVKPLGSVDLIHAFEQEAAHALPASYKACVATHNGGRPERRAFDTTESQERVLKSFLSFNREDRETVWDAREAAEGDVIPFAVDHFGNLICFDKDNRVVFWSHEEEAFEAVAQDFDAFMGMLRD